MSRSALITGIGPVSAFGLGIDPLWSAMLEGQSAIGRPQIFDPAGFKCQVAAEIPPDMLNIRSIVPKSYRKSTKVMCRDIEIAVAAAAAAVEDASLVTRGIDPETPPTIDPDRFGCHIGAGLIAADVDELADALMTSVADDRTFDMHDWGSRGIDNLTPLWLLKDLPNMLACHVTIVHDCRGPSNTITCCEASSALSIGESMRVIERSAADVCLSGGAEYRLNPLAYLRQEFAGRLAATDADEDPTAIAKPYDANARGTILGEGGGLVVLEAEESAIARGAASYARLAGFAATQSYCEDTVGIASADDEALTDAMTAAISQAGLRADEVDAVVPFACGIPAIDNAERAAIIRVFGDRAATRPLITTMPFCGNCAAGNGGITISVAAKCLREQMLPARLNTAGVSDLDANARPAVHAELRAILLLTTSQGGQNAAIVLTRSDA